MPEGVFAKKDEGMISLKMVFPNGNGFYFFNVRIRSTSSWHGIFKRNVP